MVQPIPMPIIMPASGGGTANDTGVIIIAICIFIIYLTFGSLTYMVADMEELDHVKNINKKPRYKRVLIRLSYLLLWPLRAIQLLILFIIK